MTYFKVLSRNRSGETYVSHRNP